MPKIKYTYDKDRANHILKFFETRIKHLKGPAAGEPFIPIGWQKELLERVFGELKPNGRRRYTNVWVETPKKQGKSALLSGIGLYMLGPGGVPGGQIYANAYDKRQAEIVFSESKEYILLDDVLRSRFEVYKHRIVNIHSRSFYEALSSESSGKHGLNPTCVLFDEIHTQENDELWETMTRGIISAKEPLIFAITNAGVKHSFAWSLHRYAVGIQNGNIKDDSWYVDIHAADEADDPHNPETWRKANPLLGVTVEEEMLHKLSEEAKARPEALSIFKRLHLTIWTGAYVEWIAHHRLIKCRAKGSPEDYKDWNCFVGIDMARKDDLASVAYLFVNKEETEFVWYDETFCPIETIYDRKMKSNIAFDVWAKDGYLIATEGNVHDQTYIKDRIVEWNYKLNIVQVGYDANNMSMMASALEKEYKMDVYEVKQTGYNLTEAVRFLEEHILRKDPWFTYLANPLVEWQAGNITVFRDANDNVRFHKGKSKDKIDSWAALVNAVKRYMEWKKDNNKKKRPGVGKGRLNPKAKWTRKYIDYVKENDGVTKTQFYKDWHPIGQRVLVKLMRLGLFEEKNGKLFVRHVPVKT